MAACPVAPSACLLVTQARCPAPLQVQQFEDSFTRQVKALRVQQEAAQQQLLSDMAARRPQRPKPSGEYLQQRRIQEAAARLGEFTLAHQAKQAADAMYGAGACRCRAAPRAVRL